MSSLNIKYITVLFLIFILMAINTVLLSQTVNYNWKLKDSSNTDIMGKTDECDVFLLNRSLVKSVRLVELRGSVLTVEKDGIKKQMNAGEINKIRFPGKSDFWTGVAIGFGLSLAGWTILGITFGGEQGGFEGFKIGLLYSLPSGLVGGLIGLLFDTVDETYDIAGGNPKAKLKRLRYIINKKTPGDFWKWQ